MTARGCVIPIGPYNHYLKGSIVGVIEPSSKNAKFTITMTVQLSFSVVKSITRKLWSLYQVFLGISFLQLKDRSQLNPVRLPFVKFKMVVACCLMCPLTDGCADTVLKQRISRKINSWLTFWVGKTIMWKSTPIEGVRLLVGSPSCSMIRWLCFFCARTPANFPSFEWAKHGENKPWKATTDNFSVDNRKSWKRSWWWRRSDQQK